MPQICNPENQIFFKSLETLLVKHFLSRPKHAGKWSKLSSLNFTSKKHALKILNSNNFATKKCVMKNFHGGGWYGVRGRVGGEDG